MKINKYITWIFSVLVLFMASCTEDKVQNPELTDADLKIYFWGVGDNVSALAWEGYDVLIGETLDLKLQVSPIDGTEVKWVDDATGEVLSTSVEYSYAPTEEESRKVNFIASRASGYEKEVVFNFRGNLDGYTSKINEWQSVLIPQGTQTGKFTVEFDMIPNKDNIDVVVGFLDGIATTYSNNSCIVRLNPSGKIDAFNDTAYDSDNELAYHAGVTYHVKMDIDCVNMSYDVYANEQGGAVVEIAKDYSFRKKVTHLDYWSMVAGNFNIADPGTHRILNMEITTVSQNHSPVFLPVNDLIMEGGTVVDIEIEAIDPLGGDIVLEVGDLPRFATFVDNGYGKGVLTLKPYGDCGQCDSGAYDFNIKATNTNETTDLDFVVVVDPLSIKAETSDATVWDNGTIESDLTRLVGGHVGDGAGGDGHIVDLIPFALPSVPSGKKIKSAALKVNVTLNNSWEVVEYDVYALAARSSSEVLATDFFIGAFDTDPNATGVQQGFIKNGNPTGEFVMDAASGVNLAAFLNDQFDNGATSGEFVFLRINANRNTLPTWAHLIFDSAEATATAPELILVYEAE